MKQSLARLQAQPSLSVQLRQKIDMFGQRLVGAGSYHHLGRGDGRMFKLQMKIGTSSPAPSVQQICDGRFLWIHRDLSGSRSLGRIDLDRVRKTIGDSAAPPLPAQLAFGGLPRLMQSLGEHFTFEPAVAATLGDRDVWVANGEWNSQSRAGEGGEEIKPPADGPHAVQIVLGRHDLLPRRVTFLGKAGKELDESGQPVRPKLLVMELENYQTNQIIEPIHFTYDPGDQAFSDITTQFIKQLGSVNFANVAGKERKRTDKF